MNVLDPLHQKTIVSLIRAAIPHANIYLFGSRARGTASPTSDADIMIDAGSIIDIQTMISLKNLLSESEIPYRVELVDKYAIDDQFLSLIHSHCIDLKD